MSMDIIDAKLEMIEEELEECGKVSFVTNYETAREISLEYGCLNYEDYIGIDIQSDVDGYLVDIIKDELFVIEPLLRHGKHFDIEVDKIIIDGDIEKYLDKEFYKHLFAEDVIKIQIVDEEEDFEERCDDDCEDCNCQDEDGLNDLLESEVQDFIEMLKKNNENKDFCIHCALKELLCDMYNLGHKIGANDMALGLSDMLSNIVEEE